MQRRSGQAAAVVGGGVFCGILPEVLLGLPLGESLEKEQGIHKALSLRHNQTSAYHCVKVAFG